MAFERRPLRVTVMFVDDKDAEVTFYLQVLRSVAAKAATMYWPSTTNPIELEFFGMSPERGESTDAFLQRFEDALYCRSTDPLINEMSSRLQAVVLDLFFEVPPLRDGSALSGDSLAGKVQAIRFDLNCMLLSSLFKSGDLGVGAPKSAPVSHKSLLKREEGALLFLRELIAPIRRKFETPFWSALREYADEPKLILHAMASADARQSERSVTTDDFIDYFGAGYFQTEGSSTADPLDSLLKPHSSIRDAQQQFAVTFGHDACYFVTAGTSTANKVLHTALTGPQSVVVLDRNCHISHHYGVALAGSTPMYLSPAKSKIAGIEGAIESSSLIRTLEDLYQCKAAGRPILPALIAVTNCTFDGHFISAKNLIEIVVDFLIKHDCAERLDEIVFLFDEAWFSFAHFHPTYSFSTAAYAVRHFRHHTGDLGRFYQSKLRVYATQSVHKTTFSFRQASVILSSDGVLKKADTAAITIRNSLEQAFRAYTTTSPHLGMLASLDVGRRQMSLEGCKLVEAALLQARVVNQAFAENTNIFAGRFVVAADEALAPVENLNLKVFIDQTKRTIVSGSGESGKTMRDRLWNTFRVQVNKFSSNSVLCMIMPGFSDTQTARLIEAFQGYSQRPVSASLSDSKKEQTLEFPEQRKYSNLSGTLKTALEFVRSRDQFQMANFTFVRDSKEQSWVSLLVPLKREELMAVSARVGDLVSLGFVTPYPPGYPVLVPSELISIEMACSLAELDHGEVHGLIETENGPSLLVGAHNPTCERP